MYIVLFCHLEILTYDIWNQSMYASIWQPSFIFFIPLFSSNSLEDWSFIFKSLNFLAFIFVCDILHVPYFILFPWITLLIPAPFNKLAILTH